MSFFLTYWYLESFPRFIQALQQTIESFENSLAVKDTARNISKPLFQDYTYQGRIIGFLLRCTRIFFGLILYAFIAIGYALAYAIWLLFPGICTASLIGSFFGGLL